MKAVNHSMHRTFHRDIAAEKAQHAKSGDF